VLTSLAAASAAASNVTEFPDNGSEQMGRGGAWVARASDPLATLYNPAGLAGQPTKLTLQANLPFAQTCFHRMRDPNDTTQDTPLLTPGANGQQYYANVCDDVGTIPVPSLGLTLRLSPRIGLGILVTAPSGAGSQAWPEFATTSTGSQYPAPERYLATYTNAFFLTPTIGLGVEPVDNLRFGASFIAGIANATFSNGSMAVNGTSEDPRTNDIKATLSTATVFVPGFTLGALWSATRNFDVSAWYKWSAPVDASADVKTYANYYNLGSTVATGNSALADCGFAQPAGICSPGLGHVKLNIPMEAKLGFRFHQLRPGVALEGGDKHRRDPMAQDVWDAELDLTWANDSAIDYLNISFPAQGDGTGTIPVNGTPGSVPPNASIPHMYNDVIGARLGGDYNAIPNKLAIRAGAFFESEAAPSSNGQNPTMATDFMSGARIGLALGATLRIPLKKDAPPTEGGALELSLGYMHMFVTDLNNDGSQGGIRALAGTACISGTAMNGVCGDGTPANRSNYFVNLGTITSSVDVINVGASYRF
jgi:long-chain fatty acid transport protein